MTIDELRQAMIGYVSSIILMLDLLFLIYPLNRTI